MSAAIVTRSTAAPLLELAELPHHAFAGRGYRAQHGCPRGRQWYGPARELELDAMRDAAAHERRCASTGSRSQEPRTTM